MPTDAIASAKVKIWKYRVEVNGLPAYLVEEFDPGKRSIAVVESAGAGQNYADKEAGMMKFDNAKLKNTLPVDGPGKMFWATQMDKAQDPRTGNGLPPTSYRFNFTMYELDNAGNPIRAWEYHQAFVADYTPGQKNSLTTDKNAMEEVEIAYNYYVPREINSAT